MFSSVIWGNDSLAIIFDRWWNNRNTKTYVFSPSNPNMKARILYDRNYQDRYSDPGRFVTEKGNFGEKVLALNNKKAFLLGAGFTKSGQFLLMKLI